MKTKNSHEIFELSFSTKKKGGELRIEKQNVK